MVNTFFTGTDLGQDCTCSLADHFDEVERAGVGYTDPVRRVHEKEKEEHCLMSSLMSLETPEISVSRTHDGENRGKETFSEYS